MSAAEQRKLSESQFNAVKAAASGRQRAGWAEAGFPTARTAASRLNAVLHEDCGLTVDIFGRAVKATKATTGP